MGQVKVFQRHIANVIVIRHFLTGSFAGFRVGRGFGSVAGFHHDVFRQDILLVKEHGQIALYLPGSKYPVMEC